MRACELDDALAASDKGRSLCEEDEYADQVTGLAAFARLKESISKT